MEQEGLNKLNKASRLLQPHRNAEFPKAINETIKTLSVPLEAGLKAAGVSADDAENITGNFVKIANPIFRGLAGAFISGAQGGAAGVAQGLGKQLVEALITSLKPVMLDSATFPSYTKKTAGPLIESVNNFKGWDKTDNERFRSDRAEVGEITQKMINDVTELIIKTGRHHLVALNLIALNNR